MKNDVLNAIKSIPFKEVSMGYRTVNLFSSEELEEAQLGYSIDINGQSLAGTGDGDWHSSWLVIGDEDQMGNPIFIDTDDEQLPVYTAMHGAGDWEPEKIAVSLKSFILTLDYINKLSVDRENPIKLEKKPISLNERKQILKLISETNEHVEMEFWLSWLENE